MSAHDFRIHAVGREVIVTCETCEDEIAASMGTIRLTEVERCVALHNGQTETPPEASKNGSDDNPHESDGTAPEACSYCGDVWPCAGSGNGSPRRMCGDGDCSMWEYPHDEHAPPGNGSSCDDARP